MEHALNKVITGLSASGSSVRVGVEGGSLMIFDNMRLCCERRYLSTCGEDLTYYVGATFLGVEARPHRDRFTEPHRVRETMFVDLKTSKGVFTFNCYNDHNGYYGGFSLKTQWVPDYVEDPHTDCEK